MQPRRQAIAGLVALCCATSLAACGSNDEPTATKTVTVPAEGESSGSSGTPSSDTSSSAMEGMEGEHSPIPPLTEPMTPAQIYDQQRKGVFYIYGRSEFGGLGSGTGFIHDEELGLGITNAHVVQGLSPIKGVMMGEEITLHVLGVDPCMDLAVVAFTEPLPEDAIRLPIGDSDDVQAGTMATAIGYPMTLDASGRKRAESVVTFGGIENARSNANLDPSLPHYEDAILHGASLNPGNSGGPLFDDKGNVIGINAIASQETTQFYSIPINAAHEKADTLKERIDINNMGWSMVAVSPDPYAYTLEMIYEQYGLGSAETGAAADEALRKENISGMLITDIETGSSAAEGNLQPGQLVTTLNGRSVNTMQQVCDITAGQMEGVITAEGISIIPETFGEQFSTELTVKADPGMHSDEEGHGE